VQPDAVDDVVSEVLLRIYERVLEDAYAVPCTTAEATRRVLDHVDNLVRAHVRTRQREEARLRALGEAADRLPAADADHAERQAEAALARREAALIRRIPASAVQRLVVLLHVHPEQVGVADLRPALAASGLRRHGGAPRQVGLTRDLAALRRLLSVWLPRGTLLADVAGGTGRHGPLRLWLAWILRGPPGSSDIAAWPARERARALNWLDQQLSRGRRALRAALVG
jgi:hypothetical protein